MIKKLFIFLTLSLCFPLNAFCGKVEDAILQGSALAHKKDYDGAIKEFESAHALDPSSPLGKKSKEQADATRKSPKAK